MKNSYSSMYCLSLSSGSTFDSFIWDGFSVFGSFGEDGSIFWCEFEGERTVSGGVASHLGVACCFGDCSGVFANKSTTQFERISFTCLVSVRSASTILNSSLGGGGSGVFDFLCSSLTVFLFFSGCWQPCMVADFSSIRDFDFTLSSFSCIISSFAT